MQEILPLVPSFCMEVLDLLQGLLVVLPAFFLPGEFLLEHGQPPFGLPVVFRAVGFPALTVCIEVLLGVIQTEKGDPFRHCPVIHGGILQGHLHHDGITVTDTCVDSAVRIHGNGDIVDMCVCRQVPVEG